MGTIVKFVKDTIVGGIFFLLPIIVLLVISQKLWQKMSGIGHHLSALLNIHSIIGLEAAPILTTLVIALICFISGLLLRLTFMEKFRKIVDRILAKLIPGYQLHRSALQEKIGSSEIEDARQPVLITLDGVGQAGVIIEEMSDGRKVVFIPAKPGTTEGQVFVVGNDSIQYLNTQEGHLNKILKHQGKGLGAILNSR